MILTRLYQSIAEIKIVANLTSSWTLLSLPFFPLFLKIPAFFNSLWPLISSRVLSFRKLGRLWKQVFFTISSVYAQRRSVDCELQVTLHYRPFNQFEPGVTNMYLLQLNSRTWFRRILTLIGMQGFNSAPFHLLRFAKIVWWCHILELLLLHLSKYISK